MKLEWVSIGIVLLTVASVNQLSKLNQAWILKVLDWFPAILFAYVIPALFTHMLGLDLSSAYLHTLSRNWLIPFAILLVMSALPFWQLRMVGIKPILLFFIGSAAVATLPVMLVFTFGWLNEEINELFLINQLWKGLVPIVGGWIGGSTSQLVLKELAGTEEGVFLSILVLDNILVNIWTILMFQFIKRSESMNRIFGIQNTIGAMETQEDMLPRRPILLVLSIVVFITVCTNFLVDEFFWRVLSLSAIGLALGNFIPRWNTKVVLKLGSLAIITIMAILGLRLDFGHFSLPAPLVMLVVVWLLGHFVIMFACALVLRLNLAWVAIGSMANLGGISTAPAVTSAYNANLMPHAVLLAILSMITGTSWGMVTIYLFGLLNAT